MNDLERKELRRRARAMSEEEQSIAIRCFRSTVITGEVTRRLIARESEVNDFARTFLRYREAENEE